MPLLRFIRRKWLLRRPFPVAWKQVLENRVPYYGQLPGNLKKKLREHIIIFMDEKLFEGCGGLELTEEKRVIISAYACVLILGESSDFYSDLQSILVYPDDYIAPVHEEGDSGIVTEGSEARKGEFWNLGSIVLSWKDIQQNISKNLSRQNIIFHEFAHQLDDRYGLTAGVREDGEILRDDEWTRVLASVFLNLRKKSRFGKTSVLDFYGAEHPAELFAVATEACFCTPHELQREYPELYRLLINFYNLDPGLFISTSAK